MVPLSPQSLIISARTLALMGAQDDYTFGDAPPRSLHCLLYTSDAADE